MIRPIVAALLLAFVTAVGLGALTAGRSGAATGPATLQVLTPTVDVAHGAAAFAAAVDGQSLAEGDRVRTGHQGHALITFFDGSTLELMPDTEVRIESASSRDGTTDIGIAQAIGRTVSAVHKLVDPRSRYEVRTPALAAVVRGTLFSITVAANGDTEEVTAEGLVAVTAGGTEVLVPPGAATHSSPGGTPSAPTPVAPGTPLPSPRPTAFPSVRPATVSVAPTVDPIVPQVPFPTVPIEPTISARPTPSLGGSLVTTPPSVAPLSSAQVAPPSGASPVLSTAVPLVTAAPVPSVVPSTLLSPSPLPSIEPSNLPSPSPLPSILPSASPAPSITPSLAPSPLPSVLPSPSPLP